MARVEVREYNPEWKNAFERVYEHVWPAVQHCSLSLEHVGSTSVPGLAAKPIIDACIVVASPRDIPYVVKALTKLGYEHRGELGVPGREAFKASAGLALPKHHLYASVRGSMSLRNHLGFRDYLRSHPDAAKEYGELKLRLAKKYPDDIDNYIHGKTDFVLVVLKTLGFSDEELWTLREINKLENLARPQAPTRSALQRNLNVE